MYGQVQPNQIAPGNYSNDPSFYGQSNSGMMVMQPMQPQMNGMQPMQPQMMVVPVMQIGANVLLLG